jgi:hypothetical protein
MLTRARHWSLDGATWIQYKLSGPICLTCNLILSSNSFLDLSSFSSTENLSQNSTLTGPRIENLTPRIVEGSAAGPAGTGGRGCDTPVGEWQRASGISRCQQSKRIWLCEDLTSLSIWLWICTAGGNQEGLSLKGFTSSQGRGSYRTRATLEMGRGA